MMKNTNWLVLIMALLVSCNLKSQDEELNDDNSITLFVGTYTAEGSHGVYIYQFDTLQVKTLLVDSISIVNPSFMTLTPDEKLFYSVSESNDAKIDGVHGYLFDSNKRSLKYINSELTHSEAPCHILYSENERVLYTANYGGGSVSSFQIGDLGFIMGDASVYDFDFTETSLTDRQEQAHIHHLLLSPDNKHLFINDLGNNMIYQYENSPKIDFSQFKGYYTGEATGPRHSVFHPNERWLYLLTELSGEVIAYNYSDGELSEFQRIEADSLKAQGSADIVISKDGRYLYSSHRLKGDGVSIFSIDPESGLLTKIAYQDTGSHPRNIAVTPNGSHLLVACRDSNTVEFYKIEESGLLTNTNHSIALSMPVCLLMSSK